jgi:hypothetical protein
VSGGGSAGAVALAGFSGSVTAGSDGVVLSEGDINASVSAGKDVFVLAHGDVTGGYSAGRDAAVVTYGDFNAGVSAARDVGYVLAGGDISGAISADRSIGQHHNFLNTFTAATGDAVFAYGDISASISAMNLSGSSGGGMIAGVGAGGPISGSITAAGTLGRVRSGDNITATISSANTPSLSPFDTTLQSLTAPSLPPSIAPGLLSDVAAALASLNTDKADLLASLATSLSDAATSRTDTLSDFATATADHATSVTNLIATSASSVAADITALETAFKADQQAATNALQQAVDAINGIFAQAESELNQTRQSRAKLHSDATTAKASLLANIAADVIRRNQAGADAAAEMIDDESKWRTKFKDDEQTLLEWFGNATFALEDAYYDFFAFAQGIVENWSWQGYFSGIWNEVSAWPTGFYNFGYNTISGLYSLGSDLAWGIWNWSDVATYLPDSARSLPQTLKSMVVGTLQDMWEKAQTPEGRGELLAGAVFEILTARIGTMTRAVDAADGAADVSRVGRHADEVIVTRSVDFMDDVGQLSGKLFPKDKIPALVNYLERRGIYLYEGVNGSFDGVEGIMRLPRNPTRLNVLHELSHMLDYQKYGDDYYRIFTQAQREQMVLERLKNNRIWDQLTDLEREWSLNYPSTR